MLITLNNVGKSYGIDVILENITATVNDNDRIGIIGENGAGKTTLLNMLMGILENDTGDIILGDNVTVGYLKQMDGLTLENTMYQEMETVFAKVFDAIKDIDNLQNQLQLTPNDEELLNKIHDLQNIIYAHDGYNTDFQIKKMLNGMGFSEDEYQKKISVLSGGERTRVNLAKLLLENPDILILDEPTNHLDFDTLIWLEDYLLTYKGGIIAVSHDRFFLDKIAKKIWEVEDCLLYEYKGNYTAFSMQKEEKLKLQQKQYEADMEKVAKLQDYIDRNLVRASTTKMAQSRRKTLEKMEVTQKPRSPRVPLKFNFEFESKPYDEILTIENLSISAGNKKLIDSLNLQVLRGQRLIIAGANGCGKTTLMSAITGRKKPNGGKIKHGMGSKSAVFDQHLKVNGNTVIDDIWAIRPKWTENEVRNYLARFGYRGEDVFKECISLSGGERARLRFCEISLEGANILFLDEPTNHLDIYMREAITNALSDYKGTIVIITHDRFLMSELKCPIMNIENNTGVFYESFEDFIAKRSVQSFTTKNKTSQLKEEKPSNQVNQKELRRQSAKNRLRVKECERDMEALQISINEFEQDMLNPEITTNPEKMSVLWSNLEQAKEKMDLLMEEWLTLSENE